MIKTFTINKLTWTIASALVFSTYMKSDGQNLALGKDCDASTNCCGNSYNAQKAFDGNLATSWIASDEKFPHSIVVDLDNVIALSSVKIIFTSNTNWYYLVEGSNTNANFEILADKRGIGVRGEAITTQVEGNYRYVRLTITGADGAWASCKELEIYGQVLNQPRNLVPDPVPLSTGNYMIGAQMCNLWGEKGMWADHLVGKYEERKPVLGWYDEAMDVATDWQIKIAVEHGVSFFMPCWYRAKYNNGKPVMGKYDQFIRSIANTAQHRDKIKWAIQWINGTESWRPNDTTLLNVDDFEYNVIPYWIKNFFLKSNYLKIDNKPVVSIYDAPAFISNCGGIANANRGIAILRQACVNAGLSGAFVLTARNASSSPTDPNKIAEIIGWQPTQEKKDAIALELKKAREKDSITALLNTDALYSYHVPTFTNFGLNDPATIAQKVDAQKNAWQAYENETSQPYITTASQGWDNIWANPRDFRWKLNPDGYQQLLLAAKNRMDSKPSTSLDSKMILLDNWNEYSEGHVIFPDAQYGYGHLEAVQKAFTSSNNFISDQPDLSTIPQLAGQVQTQYVWNFAKSTEGWTPSSAAANGAEYVLDVKVLATDPSLRSPSNLAISGKTYKYVLVWMKNATSDSQAVLFWTTAASGSEGGGKAVVFPIVPNDNVFRQYIIDLSNHPEWKDTDMIATLRLDPVENVSTGFVHIKQIKVFGTYSNVPVSIPSVVEAENYNLGGEGNAYHDNDPANNGNQYRTNEGVDLQVCQEGGYNIGWTNTGEWTEYLINVPTTANYTITCSYASLGNTNQYRIEANGVDITGNITVPTTGDFQTFKPSHMTTRLQKGLSLIRLNIAQSDGTFNINRMNFATSIATALEEENTNNHYINIYPNPTSDNLALETNSENPQAVTISNMMGQVLHQSSISHNTLIPVAGWAAGLYLLSVNGINKTFSVVK